MQVNVQFLQQLQPEWSRFMTVVKQTVDLDRESYHKLFDILKQYQNEVNEICAEKIAKNSNPLPLVAAAQQYLDPYYQAPKSHKSYAPPSKQSSSTRSHAPTRYKGKEIAKPITPPSESAYEKDMTVVEARETVGSQVVQQTGIQCFNYKEFGHFAKECRKPKREKDYTYHKEKMLLCKQAEKGVPLQVKQADWLEDTDKKVDEQDLEEHYMYMEKIQEVHTTDSGPSFDVEPLKKVHSDDDYNVFASERQHYEQPESINNTCGVEMVGSNVIPDSLDMCDNDNQADQNVEECDDERVVLANLIANLKLDTDENKKIQKQLKKANTSLAHELQECKSALEK
ncbi:retrovirus-related pol polyprotein from transposon TNT 1-94 [Tanacetum coccineum]